MPENQSASFGRRRSSAPSPATPSSWSWVWTPSPRSGEFPAWPFAVGALLVVEGLQRFPPTGVVLMMMAAPLWPIVLFNLLLLTMVADVLRGAAPRWLIVVPAVVYGLNLIASAASFIAYLLLSLNISSANAQAAIPFDPARNAVVSERAQSLVEGYQLPVAYAPPERGATDQIMAFRVLPEETCESLPRTDMTSPVRKSFISRGRASVSNACTLRTPETPRLPILTVSQSDAPLSGLLEGRTSTITLAPAGGKAIAVRQADVRVLPPIPMLVSGCALNSGHLEWQCHTGLLRLPMRIARDKHADPSALVARALGLSPRTVREAPRENYQARQAFDDAETRALASDADAAGSLQEARVTAAAEVNEQLAALDAWLKPGGGPDLRIDLRLLQTNADQLAPRADAIMARIERPAASDQAIRQRSMLLELAASLPPAEFSRIGGRFYRAVATGEEPVDGALIIVRLGDVGPAAWSYLEDRMAEDRFSGMAAVTALCRAGHSSLAPAMANNRPQARDTGFAYARQEVQVVALARMGRADLARPLLEAMTGPRRAWAERQLREVTPASPATRCRSIRERLFLPPLPWLKAAG